MAPMVANDLALRNPTKITLNFPVQQQDEEEKTDEEESKIEEVKEPDKVLITGCTQASSGSSQQEWEKLIEKELNLSEESQLSSQSQ